MASSKGIKLRSQDITRVLPTTERNYSLLLRSVIILISFIIAFIFHNSPVAARVVIWLLLGALCYLTIFRYNREASNWLLSECRDKQWDISRIQPRFQEDEQPTGPTSIEPGNYIRCSRDSATQELQESNSTDASSAQSMLTYYQVIATRRSPHSEMIKIDVFGREDPLDADPANTDVKYYKRQPSNQGGSNDNRHQSAVAAALEDLMKLLPDYGNSMYENELAGQMVNRLNHHPSSVRLAFRIAESGGLINRDRRRPYFIEWPNLFRPSIRVTGHAHCLLSLTKSGAMWKQAEPIGD